ncbi:histidine phosphatase family protein [Streptomyces malaysiensis]|uniref:histidine phosphatase family protein n=1 Tax=Streptomyces malaysiensis TaxID=92644 RepID=UPI002B27CCA3|nr:histidine phosphatase family protein [Streptomyces malaysiensis]
MLLAVGGVQGGAELIVRMNAVVAEGRREGELQDVSGRDRQGVFEEPDRTDPPLTAHGEEQSRALRPLLGTRKTGQTLVSPMGRAVRTARLAGLVEGRVAGLDEAAFVAAAEDAKKNCPVSQALAGTEITLTAKLA